MIKVLGDIKYKRGDTRPIRIRIKNPETNEYLDLTGCILTMVIDPDSAPVNESNNIARIDGIIDPDQVLNKGRVIFPLTTTQSNHIGTYYYEIQMIDVSGYTSTLNEKPFKFKISQDLVK